MFQMGHYVMEKRVIYLDGTMNSCISNAQDAFMASLVLTPKPT
jgi:hypothetical protein